MIFWKFISFHLFILAFWAFISFYFDHFGIQFLSFWPFGLSFAFILTVYFWTCVSFHFGLLGLHFLSIWPFRLSFPFNLAFSAFISFHFGLLGLRFLSFWPFVPSSPSFVLLGAWSVGPPSQVAKNGPFLRSFEMGFNSPGPPIIFWFFTFPFGRWFPFISAFWAFISFHFGLLGLRFLSFWPFGFSFPFILRFWAFIPFDFGPLWLHLLILPFWRAGPWAPVHELRKTGHFPEVFK